MSEQQTLRGTVRLIKEGHVNALNKFVKKLLPDDYDIPEYFQNEVEYLVDEYHEQYYYDKERGRLYVIEDVKDIDNHDFFYIVQKNDYEIEFITSFYNGGTCLSEVLDENL